MTNSIVDDKNTQTPVAEPVAAALTPKPDEQPTSDSGNEPNIPAKLSSADEIKALMQKVREQEKNKLYPKLDELKKKLAESDQQIAELKAAKGEAETRLQESGKKKSEELTSLDGQLKKLESEFTQFKTSVEEEKKTLAERARQAELAAYKMSKIQEIGQGIIPELVTGNTEEEIDATVIFAKQKYDELAASIMADEQMRKSGQQGIKPTAPMRQEKTIINGPAIRNLSPADWGKQRESMLERIRRGEISPFKAS